jgi:uncharacterized membrane protein YwzB
MLRSVRAWLRLAAHPAVVKRALAMAAVVGLILIAINHGPAILAGRLTRFRLLQICLTIVVPYVVSTVSSVAARNDRR